MLQFVMPGLGTALAASNLVTHQVGFLKMIGQKKMGVKFTKFRFLKLIQWKRRNCSENYWVWHSWDDHYEMTTRDFPSISMVWSLPGIMQILRVPTLNSHLPDTRPVGWRFLKYNFTVKLKTGPSECPYLQTLWVLQCGHICLEVTDLSNSPFSCQDFPNF